MQSSPAQPTHLTVRLGGQDKHISMPPKCPLLTSQVPPCLKGHHWSHSLRTPVNMPIVPQEGSPPVVVDSSDWLPVNW